MQRLTYPCPPGILHGALSLLEAPISHSPSCRTSQNSWENLEGSKNSSSVLAPLKNPRRFYGSAHQRPQKKAGGVIRAPGTGVAAASAGRTTAGRTARASSWLPRPQPCLRHLSFSLLLLTLHARPAELHDVQVLDGSSERTEAPLTSENPWSIWTGGPPAPTTGCRPPLAPPRHTTGAQGAMRRSR